MVAGLACSGGAGRSRTDLLGFAIRCITALLPRHWILWNVSSAAFALEQESGAGNESRTRDLNLGKVALYQLSYSRVFLFCFSSEEVGIIKFWYFLSSIGWKNIGVYFDVVLFFQVIFICHWCVYGVFCCNGFVPLI